MLSTKERVEIITDSIDHYSLGYNIDVAIEEMSELTKALCKYNRSLEEGYNPIQNDVNVIEECADVFITTTKIAMLFGFKEVDDMIDAKLIRLKERMNKDEDIEKDIMEDRLSDILNEDEV